MVPSETSPTRTDSFLRPTALALAVAASLALLLGCRQPSARLSPTRGLILISIDTLRADHLGCYGYDRPTSPFLDSLSGRGVLFENAVVQLPGTLPSHMSIFTGLYPEEHGVRPPDGILAPDVTTLPELLQGRGFRTAGHSEGGYVHGGYGFARGFDEWSHDAWSIESDAERTFARGRDFLRRLAGDDRFFLFLHTYSVHDPYSPLDEHTSYPRKKYASLFWAGPEPDVFPPTGLNLGAFNRGEKRLSAAGLELFRARYDAAISYVDDVVRDFFGELEALGLGDDVTVVLTSDHGEELLDHGKLAHQQIYPECLHVPLIVLHPEVTGPRRVREVVESVDIAPTLLEIAGIPAPASSGRSLVGELLGRSEEAAEAYTIALGGEARSLIRADAEGFHQLLVSYPTFEDDSLWMERELSFDAPHGRVELEVTSHHEPRELQVEVDGGDVGRYRILPTEWSRIGFDLPSFSRVTFTTDGCLSPASLGVSADGRCLSVLLRGLSHLDLRLYDLELDPGARRDRSRDAEPRLRELLRRLRRYERLEQVSTAPVTELDPELTERLRALGYLQ